MNTCIRTAIVGAGAVGGLLAAAAVRGGHTVSVLARGRTLDAIRADGIRVIGEHGSTVARVTASDDAVALGVQDFVVVALKAQVLPEIAASLRPLIGAHTIIVGAMNGLPWWFLTDTPGSLSGRHLDAVDPGGTVLATLPPAQTIGCVAHLSSSTEAPGIIRRGLGNTLIIGSPQSALMPAAASLAEVWQAGGFDVSVSADIRTDVWLKLWGNMSLNPLSALTGSMGDRLLTDMSTQALALRMMEEAGTIGERLGLTMGMSAQERLVMAGRLGAFKTSMLQDFEAGRPLETEAILGVFPELGRKLGVPTPFCEAVLGLLRQRVLNSQLLIREPDAERQPFARAQERG